MNIPLFFGDFHTYSREIIDVFPDLTKLFNMGFFCGRCLKEVFQTLLDYYLASLPIHTRCKDLDLVSRSQVYQNYKLQIVL